MGARYHSVRAFGGHAAVLLILDGEDGEVDTHGRAADLQIKGQSMVSRQRNP